ncbi:MAG TPA: spore cortex biosynthesis protein YabQ [Bacillota bacterium]|nr:spore cortex biosynthesis protein YabQ [Bacillota bacterium]HPT88697.1 spore cortex biosynthesis protein YabQ [Bacillota bacterium]
MEYVHSQLSSCLLLLLTGIVLGGFFDLYRVFRGMIKAKGWMTYSGDLLFWVLATVVMIPLMYWSTWLELRLYVWLAIGAGLIGYYVFFSRALIAVWIKFWRMFFWWPRQFKWGFSCMARSGKRMTRRFRWRRNKKQGG